MKVENLEHVLRAIDDFTSVEYQFLLLGSQAILAHIDPDYFPELAERDCLFHSQEIDVAPLVEDSKTQEALADEISGTLGEFTHFDNTHGYHADGVTLSTPTLAPGWRDRLKPYESDGVTSNKFFALSYEDLAVSKIMAGRPKDIDFVKDMCLAFPSHPGLNAVEGLLNSLNDSPMKSLALDRWRAMSSSPLRPSFKP